MAHTLDEFMDVLPRARRYGHYVAGLCPWHEDTKPSLFVYKDDWFRCVATDCQEQGRHDKLYNKLQNPTGYFPPEGKDYYPPSVPDNLQKFAESSHNLLNRYDFRKTYLTERGIRGMIETARIGWFEGWYTVPVLGEDRDVEGMVLSASPSVRKRTGYRYITNQEPMPYIPDHSLFDRSEALAVTFGIFDALVIAEYGYPAMTTTGGAQTFNPEWLDWWRLPVKIIPDEREESTAYEVARYLDWRGEVVTLDYPEGGKDINDIYQIQGEDELKRVLKEVLE